jgi:hypothetical protein
MPQSLVEAIKRTQMIMIQRMAQSRITERSSLILEERARKLEQRAEQLIPMINERIRVGVEQAQQHATMMSESLNKRVETYNQIRQNENQALQSRLEFSQQQVGALNYTRDRLQVEVAKQEHRNTQNQAEINNLRGQLANALNQANNSDGGGDCTIL